MPEINSTAVTPLRRSPRFLHLPITSYKTPKYSVNPTLTHCSVKALTKSGGSNNTRRESPRLESGIDMTPILRRSPRFSHQVNEKELVKKKLEGSRNFDTVIEGLPRVTRSGKGFSRKKLVKNTVIDLRKSPRLRNRTLPNREIENNVTPKTLGNGDIKSAREVSRFCLEDKHSSDGIVLGLRAEGKARGTMQKAVSEENEIRRKRKRETDSKMSYQGWTREQELALQNAYFTAKPTPLFWKKVSKLVPGKSAKDCFDKIHADHATPVQQQPRSRANKLNSSKVEVFSLSASKLLQPTNAKAKKSSYYKHKSHLAQKTVRGLLQKQHLANQGCQGDLFSVLECDGNPSVEGNLINAILSTPKHAQVKQKFLQKYQDKSSSGCKKPLSRLNGSCVTDLVSPPVLKQVKNRALHEKYIDQLHCREAKRRTESKCTKKAFAGKKNRTGMSSWTVDVDVVKAAKSALVSDTRDALNQLKHLQAGSPSNSFDLGDEAISNDDDEGDL